MTRIAHIIALAFLLVAILGQFTGPAFGDAQTMDCCDPEIMQEMHGMSGHENGDCSQERQCPGGDACCTQAIASIPALMPASDEASSRLFGQLPFEMAAVQQPNSAPVAPFSEPPIA